MVASLQEQLQEYHCNHSALYQSLTLEENIVAVMTQDKVIDDNLKRQIKNRTFCTCRLLLITYIFQYISNWSKYFSFYPPSLFNIHD